MTLRGPAGSTAEFAAACGRRAARCAGRAGGERPRGLPCRIAHRTVLLRIVPGSGRIRALGVRGSGRRGAGRAREAVASTETARERAGAAVDAFVKLMVDDPAMGRVLLLAPLSEPALSRRGIDLMPGFVGLVHDQLSAVDDRSRSNSSRSVWSAHSRRCSSDISTELLPRHASNSSLIASRWWWRQTRPATSEVRMPFQVSVDDPTRPQPELRVLDRKFFQLVGEFVYVHGETVVTVPGCAPMPCLLRTDLASIPAPLQGLLTPYGRQLLPAIMHDDLCKRASAQGQEGNALRRRADELFRLALLDEGVGPFRSRIFWVGVEVGRFGASPRSPGSC